MSLRCLDRAGLGRFQWATVDYVIVPLAYLIGSVPMAIVVARLLKLPDPRTIGSGNPGATNLLRYGGRLAGALTLAGDVLKGVVVAWIARTFIVDTGIIAASAIAVFLGHLYPVFFRFQGGKGVATALGVWSVLVPTVGGLLLLTWLIVAVAFRYSSLAALVAACAAPLYAWWFAPASAYIAAAAVMTLLLIWRHRGNIRNLMNGSETRIRLSRQSVQGR
jgi:acyl phosphate:glycerol-3-phosphate acyltransferase